MSLIEKTPSAYAYPLLIKQLLHTPLAHSPDQEIVYRDLIRHTYRDLRKRIGRLADGLTKLGIKAGDTVAVMDWDSHRYLECFFAIPMMGAVLQTVNIRLSPEQILYTLNHAEADVVLVNAEFLPLLDAIKDRLETAKKFVLISDDGVFVASPAASLIPIATDYESLLAAASADYAFPDFDENTRATIFYTTGTTGSPKGVYFSHRQLVLHTLSELAAMGIPGNQGRIHKEDVYMPITPMFHVHAWGFPYTCTMMGLKQVYPGRYAPEILLGLIQKEKVTFSHCVPTILHMLLTSPAAREVDLSNWKVVIGGAALPKGLAKAALDRGVDIFSGYGLSETCPMLTVAHLTSAMETGSADEQINFRTKSGLPVPLVELRVVDEDMKEVAHDGKTTGEVVVRAPWLTQGYLKNSEASEQLWRGGYLHTGDIGHIDAQGYLQITDRIKDVIKTGGEWISSLALEDIISRHQAVSEVAVIGVKDEKWGERPLALVVLKAEHAGKINQEEIKSHLKHSVDQGVISLYAIPEDVIFVDVLEKTSVGKLNKKAMREKYQR